MSSGAGFSGVAAVSSGECLGVRVSGESAGPHQGEVVDFASGVVVVDRHVLTRLTISTLSYLSAHPGFSRAQIREGLGVRQVSQVSRLLGRLERRELVQSESGAGESGWRLTVSGRELLNQVQPVWRAHPSGTASVTSREGAR